MDQDVRDGALHAVGLDGTDPQDVIVGEANERQLQRNCVEVHADLLTLRAADGGLVFVSLAQPAARRLRKITLPEGATAPHCMLRHPTKPLFLYVVQTAAKIQLWVVEATGDAVGEPVLKRELDTVMDATFRELLFGG